MPDFVGRALSSTKSPGFLTVVHLIACRSSINQIISRLDGPPADAGPQGDLFAAVAQSLTRADVQLLPVSIDALGDTPSKVASWQARFGHYSAWRTAVADVKDVDRLGDFMKGLAGPARLGWWWSSTMVAGWRRWCRAYNCALQ